MPHYMTVTPDIPGELDGAYVESSQFEEDFRWVEHRILGLEQELEDYKDYGDEEPANSPQCVDWTSRVSWLRQEGERWDQELSKFLEAKGVYVGDEDSVEETNEEEIIQPCTSRFDTQAGCTSEGAVGEDGEGGEASTSESESEAGVRTCFNEDGLDEDEYAVRDQGDVRNIKPDATPVFLPSAILEASEGADGEDNTGDHGIRHWPLLAVDVQNAASSGIGPGEGGASTSGKKGRSKRTLFGGKQKVSRGGGTGWRRFGGIRSLD